MTAGQGAARHPHEELLRRSAQAVAAGALGRLRELHDEGVVVHYPGGVAHRGRAAVARLATLGARLRTEFHDLLANDEHGVVLQTLRAERDGRTIEVHCALVCHFRAGKIAEVWIHTDDPHALEEL